MKCRAKFVKVLIFNFYSLQSGDTSPDASATEIHIDGLERIEARSNEAENAENKSDPEDSAIEQKHESVEDDDASLSDVSMSVSDDSTDNDSITDDASETLTLIST